MRNIDRIARPLLLLAAAMCLLAASCGVKDVEFARPGPGTDGTRVFEDDLGRRVVVPARIERAVSLAPNLTEIIFAVGGGDRLVGVTTYCDFPAGAAAIEKVGDTQTPNIERIVALKPDVVFVSKDSQLEAFMPTLEAQGIAVYVSGPKDLDQVLVTLARFGDLFGTPAHATALVENLLGRIADVKAKAESHQPVSVFLQISEEPLFTAGRDSFMTDLIARAGGRSVTADVPTGYPKLSKETAAALQPDVIVLSASEDNRAPNPALSRSPAVRNKRVYRIDPDIISRPGPLLVDALEELAGFFAPVGTSAGQK